MNDAQPKSKMIKCVSVDKLKNINLHVTFILYRFVQRSWYYKFNIPLTLKDKKPPTSGDIFERNSPHSMRKSDKTIDLSCIILLTCRNFLP